MFHFQWMDFDETVDVAAVHLKGKRGDIYNSRVSCISSATRILQFKYLYSLARLEIH